ncbi:hypothetical protein DOM22_05605 [Bdellovibrio sp. ZAP7]|uniref:YceI family protein n=1 Tax=Bdellovibrio sp. ZAP7 TaxID=2231053 RepID=UPI0011570218|nr:YceI family protein [Bdellovibrio sp. ZAP7]QDK44673.1 hypothetical protein DOM22_05605 [Bdellovibrio sp. ZAP7]
MKIRTVLLSLMLFANSSWAITEFKIDKDSSMVEFLAIGKPSALKIRGTNGKPEGKLIVNGSQFDGEITLDLSQLETGMGLRDKHMKDKYLEIEKPEFKVSKLKIESLQVDQKFWQNPTKQKTNFKGRMKLHGVEKVVAGDVEFTEASKESLAGLARFTLQLPEYGIAIPSFSGITVAEKVDVEVNFKGKLVSQ